MYLDHRDDYGFVDGSQPEANNGGMLHWLWIIPVTIVGIIAYCYGISW